MFITDLESVSGAAGGAPGSEGSFGKACARDPGFGIFGIAKVGDGNLFAILGDIGIVEAGVARGLGGTT